MAWLNRAASASQSAFLYPRPCKVRKIPKCQPFHKYSSQKEQTIMEPMSVNDMVADARTRIKGLSMEEMQRELESGDALIIDIRDVRERWREGTIPGAKHVPRGMLEFWADPQSEYHKKYMDPIAAPSSTVPVACARRLPPMFCRKWATRMLRTSKWASMAGKKRAARMRKCGFPRNTAKDKQARYEFTYPRADR